MNVTQGALAGLVLMSFVGGLAAAPDVKVVKESSVKVVKVPKLVVVRDDERVVERVTKPFPKSCTRALEYLEVVRGHDAALDKATQKMPELLSNAHTIFATGTAPELVPITEAMNQAKQEAANASIARAEALIRYDQLINECRPDLEARP